jgi:hypothetical protein
VVVWASAIVLPGDVEAPSPRNAPNGSVSAFPLPLASVRAEMLPVMFWSASACRPPSVLAFAVQTYPLR